MFPSADGLPRKKKFFERLVKSIRHPVSVDRLVQGATKFRIVKDGGKEKFMSLASFVCP